ncbi:MAG: hypothetical protein ABUT39_24780 [Acidobacteriota bacterium]
METKARLAGKIVLMALLVMAAAGMVQAQQYPQSGSPYFCRWGAAGKSIVTLTMGAPDQNYHRTGTNLNVYPDGGTLSKTFDLYWDWPAGDNVFTYVQSSTGTQCKVTTYNNGGIVSFDPCTKNGQPSLSQYCTQ